MELDPEDYALLGYGDQWAGIEKRVRQFRFRKLLLARTNKKEHRDRKRARVLQEFADCPECGQRFQNRSASGWKRSFCSDKCRTKHYNRLATEKRRELAGPLPSKCRECGREFEQPPARADGRGNRPRLYCSDKCSARHRRQNPKGSKMNLVEKNGYEKCGFCGTVRPKEALAVIECHISSNASNAFHGMAGEVKIEACKDREWCRAQPQAVKLQGALVERVRT